MKQTIKTENVLSAYRIISDAKYAKMSDEDKIKVWKIARKLKPVATQFEDDSKSAAEKFKPADYENFEDELRKAQEYEQKKGINVGMTLDEYNKFLAVFKQYNELVAKAVKEFADKEVEIEFEGLSEDAFGKLMASNDWSVSQTMEIGSLIVE